ncbi:hypothetical protein IOC57_21915 [Bacillus sp. SD075]|uniref:hypothetical protein n=1 Tax=Bacillus sp. SD075 TaxID=2781732 RepID=UPI001A969416|nr:hypothetical protein [Bacillus sp. SD075]MBO1000382.1 hypothetical protein [Bacillus sp. SD075]
MMFYRDQFRRTDDQIQADPRSNLPGHKSTAGAEDQTMNFNQLHKQRKQLSYAKALL